MTSAASALSLLVELSVRACVLVGLIGLVLWIARVRSSRGQHAVWTAVLSTMLGMPLLFSVAPSIEWPARSANVLAEAIRPTPPSVLSPADVIAEPKRGVDPPGRSSPIGNVEGPRTNAVAGPGPRLGARAIFAGYLAITLLLLVRLASGWVRAVRISRSAVRTAIPAAVPVFESGQLATPVTIGAFAPHVVLPVTWMAWPEEQLAAVLAHEIAHARRRDPLVATLAHLNRAFFWFHPAAWWLKHVLAITAEHACDEEVVGVVDAQRYVDILVEMAATARANRGRLLASGVDGSGLVGRRVEKLLRGEPAHPMSRSRLTAVAATCGLAIVLAVACRQPSEVPPALREDPEVADRLAKEATRQAVWRRGEGMTSAEVDRLEASLVTNPDDLETREKLKIFYRSSAQEVFGWNEMVIRRRPQILWLIENRPESQLAVWRLSLAGDPAGYHAAANAWRARVNAPDASALVIEHAAMFFRVDDPQAAEMLLLQGEKRYPFDRGWQRLLGDLYGQVVLGPVSPMDGSPQTRLDDDPFARLVHGKLQQSSNAELLVGAGQVLMRAYRDESRKELGRQLLVRSMAMEVPIDEAQQVRLMLVNFSENQERMRLSSRVKDRQAALAGPDIAAKFLAGTRLTADERRRFDAVEFEALSSVPASERLLFLSSLAEQSYLGGESREHARVAQEDIDSAWNRSKRAATEALAVAPGHHDTPYYSRAVYIGNIVLGLHALRNGDRRTAVHYMEEASKAPPSEQLAKTQVGGVDQRLAHYLLDAGERESVARFYEAQARLFPRTSKRLVESAAAVREGKMPENYQWLQPR